MYKICIADDERYVRKSVEQRIARSGMNVSVVGYASDGMSALRLLQKEKPDIFFVDINMPLLDGLTFIERAKEECQFIRTKFIIISGYDDFEYLQKSIRLGVVNYIKKPIVQEEFNEVLKTVCLVLDSEQQELKKITKKNQLILYEDFSVLMEKEKKQKEITCLWILIYSKKLQRLIDSMELQHFKEHLTNAFSFNHIDCIAFSGIQNVVIFSIQSTRDFSTFLTGFEQEMIQMLDGVIVYSTWLTQDIKEMVLDFENTLNVRLYDSNINIIKAQHIRQENLLDLNLLDIALEYGQSDQYINFISALIEKQFENKECLLQLNSVYHSIILLMLNKFVKYNLQIPEEMRSENTLFCMAKFRCKEEIVEALCGYGDILNKKIRDLEQGSEIITLVSKYLEQNYHNEFSLNDVADEFFVSPTYLCKRFKEKTGFTLTQYLENIRVKKAKELLDLTTQPIAEIAAAVGYHDANYFTRIFRRVYEISPSDYRKKN